MRISVYDFISLFCDFNDWSDFFFFYYHECDSDHLVNTISLEASKRMRVVSCDIDCNFICCVIDD